MQHERAANDGARIFCYLRLIVMHSLPVATVCFSSTRDVYRFGTRSKGVMRVSAKTEYACIAMLELAAQYGSSEPVRIRRIAERHDVPPRFLVQILLQLKGAGLVASVPRGSRGLPFDQAAARGLSGAGHGSHRRLRRTKMAKPPAPRPIRRPSRCFSRPGRKPAQVQRKMLGSISLADLLDRAKAQDEQMYHI